MKTMKKILAFSCKNEYDNKKNHVELWHNTNTDIYLLTYKYSSMEEENKRTYNTRELAMYDAQRKIMFLLS